MKNFIFIDYGSEGNSGFYINQMAGRLPFKKVTAFVHSDCPTLKVKTNFKVAFGKLSLKRHFYPKFLKRASRLIDLHIGLFYILIRLYFVRRLNNATVIINLYQSFYIYYLFIRFIPKKHTKILVVHDAVELDHNYPKQIMVDRRLLFEHAHALLVHNEYSVGILKDYHEKIFMIPFPLSWRHDEIPSKILTNPIKVLFLGHGRKEKGIEHLIDSFMALTDKSKSAIELSIVGSGVSKHVPNDQSYENLKIIDRFVDELEFDKLLAETHYTIFPYTGGTNSGIYANACSHCLPSIVSDIALFNRSSFYIQDLSINDNQSLKSVFEKVQNVDQIYYDELRDFLHKRTKEYDQNFVKQLFNVLRELDTLTHDKN